MGHIFYRFIWVVYNIAMKPSEVKLIFISKWNTSVKGKPEKFLLSKNNKKILGEPCCFSR